MTTGKNITLRQAGTALWSVYFLTPNGGLVTVASHLAKRDAKRLVRQANVLREADERAKEARRRAAAGFDPRFFR